MSDTVTAFFRTNTGDPSTGLVPTIRIWSVAVGSPAIDTLVVTDNMEEVGDGFYRYIFDAYDPFVEYLFRADGGVGLNSDRRYVVGGTESPDPEETWSVTLTDATSVAGSIGSTIVANQGTIESIVRTILQYECGRSVVDPIARTLTIYNTDCVTPIKVFDLKDSSGNPSVTEVFERVPIGPGSPCDGS
jgi:hypothetical protein